MLKLILQLLGLIMPFLRRIIEKRAKLKSAEEHLSETPNIDMIREEAEKKAEDKFGPRGSSPKA